ncbi:hypothetical protein ILUMI_26145 [Ignelater luminosus]|uniref:Uncharacterized protein n=1 Tax=Ignelater luminosus TaxID=2038154 RepID=A0A8K0C679_IGNLU|nr:hypothetical protein ILUMI_26145 [Ignelater luminosus]
MDSEITEILKYLPLYLQNILKYSGYDNVPVLSQLREEDIITVEKFTREDIHAFVKPDDNLETFCVSKCESKAVDWSIYSKANRTKKKRLDEASIDNNLITDYFPILNEIEHILKQNKELEMMLIDKVLKARAKTEDTSPEIKTSSGILKLLCGTAINNSNNKNPSANRYDKSLKLFCSSLFLLCGRLVYQTIQKNLPNSIPSISTTQRFLRSNDRILEGEIRLPQLKDFLLERGYPLKVWISEDQTRLVSSREYDSVNNSIVGMKMDVL